MGFWSFGLLLGELTQGPPGSRFAAPGSVAGLRLRRLQAPDVRMMIHAGQGRGTYIKLPILYLGVRKLRSLDYDCFVTAPDELP